MRKIIFVLFPCFLIAQDISLVPQIGHSGRIIGCALRGNILATAGDEGSVKLWDLETGDIIFDLPTGGSAHSVSISPDKKFLGYASMDNRIRIFDIEKNEVTKEIEGTTWWDERYRGTVYFSPSWKYVGIIKFSTPAKWPVKCKTITEVIELDTSKVIFTHKARYQCIDIRFSPDEKIVALAFRGYEKIKIYDLKTGKFLKEIPPSYLYCIDFTPDGKIIAASDRSGRITWWDIETVKKVQDLKIVEPYNWSLKFKFTEDGRYFISGHDRNQIRIWDARTSERIFELDGLKISPAGGGISDLDVSEDGKILVTAIWKTVGVWDLQKRRLLKVLSKTPNSLLGARISKDNSYICFGGLSGEVFLFNTKDQTINSVKVSDLAINSIDFSPDDKSVVVGDEEGNIKILSVPNLKEIKNLKQDGRTILCVRFSEDGKYLGVSNWDDKIWIFKDFEIHRIFRNAPDLFTNHANEISFSKDSKFVAASSKDSYLRVWDIESQKLIFSTYVATEKVGEMDYDRWIFQRWLHPVKIYGDLVIVGQWGGWRFGYIKIYDFKKKTKIASFKTHKPISIDFYNDEVFASGGNDNTIRFFNIKEKKEIFVLKGHKDFITDLQFTKDKKYLISTSWDGFVRVWDLKKKKCILNLFSPENEQLIVYTPEGYYFSNKDVEKHLRVTHKGKSYSIKEYSEKFNWRNKPEEVKIE